MFIKLILEQYIPLLSSGFTKVELDIQHLINLFIAANGTGKTSILRELSPLPPENGNYRTGGRKYFEQTKGKKRYILDSYPGVGNGHSFKVDGEEFNKNGTYQVQLDLCWEHFRITPKANRVLSGLYPRSLFSMMGPGQRKEFFLHLYPNDTSYALSVWNRLRNEKNDLKAQIKGQVARYTEENKKLERIAGCGVEELEARVKGIDEELRQSLLVRGGLQAVKVDGQLKAKIARFSDMTDRLTLNKASGFIETEDELVAGIKTTTDLLEMHEEQASGIQMLISENAGLLEGMEELLEDPQAFSHQADQLQLDITACKEELAQHETLLQNYPVLGDPEQNLVGLDQIEPAFATQLRRVVICNAEGLTGVQFKQLLAQQETLTSVLRQTKQDLEADRHQLKHYDNQELLNCPECEHEFKAGVKPEELQRLRQRVEALPKRIALLTEELSRLTDGIDNDRGWYESMLALYQFCRFNADVPCLPMLVKEYEVGKVDTVNLLNGLRCYMQTLACKKRIEELMKEHNVLETRIGLLKTDSVLDVVDYVKHWEVALDVENRRIAFYRSRLKRFNNSLSTIQNYKADLEQLGALREEILEGLKNEGLANLRSRVDERIGLLSEEKEDYLSSIIRSRSLGAVVNSIFVDIERLKRRLLVVENLMDGLCPNKGLIGRLMTDFIKTWCGNVNAILQTVWNTPLFIKPCNKENGDLTYKFPVVTGDQPPTPDVENCSLGEASIIDFAARLASLSYQGDDYPLIMDEVGTALDEIKRGRFLNFIQDLTNRKGARQLFMVSHYLTQYGAFSNPNIVAMRYEGLSLPGDVNTHSTII